MTPIEETYREYRIRPSGKQFLRIFRPEGGMLTYARYTSRAACKAVIDACIEHRPFTQEEYTLVFSSTK